MRDDEEKWERREDKSILIVDQAVSGLVDALGKDSGRCSTGGVVIFNVGSFYQINAVSICEDHASNSER